MKTPTAKQIKEARENAGLTQADAAALIYKTLRQWQRFESGAKMDPALWELFKIKTSML